MKKEIIIVTILLLTMAFIPVILYFGVLSKNPSDISENVKDVEIEEKPRSSAYWELTSSIYIDDSLTGVGAKNWTWAVSQAWCSGAGSVGDPYLIENVTITKSDGNASVYIINSGSSIYFTLNNITAKDDAVGGIGIYLENTTNGLISNGNLSANGRSGIELKSDNSTTIISNTVSSNTIVGILIWEGTRTSESNSIYANTISANGINGQDNSTTANTWDNGTNSGNAWSDYVGVDDNDDGIGDTVYDIDGTASAEDRYPVFSDGDDTEAPTIIIVKPLYKKNYKNPPEYYIMVSDNISVVSMWYNLNGGTNYTITVAIGVIDAYEWYLLVVATGEERMVLVNFYADDPAGNIGSASVWVVKHKPESEVEPEEVNVLWQYTLIMIACGIALVTWVRGYFIRKVR